MEISIQKQEGIYIVHMQGNYSGVPQLFRDVLSTLIQEEDPALLLWLDKITALSSIEIKEIVDIQEAIHKKRGQLKIVCEQSGVLNILQATRLDKVTPIYSELRQAVKDFARSRLRTV